MKIRKRVFLSIVCLIFSIGLFFGISSTFNNKKVAKAEALPIETETGVSLSKSGGNYKAEIPQIEKWRTKSIQFDIYATGALQILFRDVRLSGDYQTGIIRTTPDLTPELPNKISYEPIDHSPAYWRKDEMTPIDLGDGWYRWTFDLSKLHSASLDGTETLAQLYMASGDATIKNFKVLDCNYIAAPQNAYAVLHEPIANWRQHTIMFEAYVPDDVTRRFLLCKESGSNLAGFVAFNKNGLQYQNPDFQEGVNSYMLTDPVKPYSLGDNWYLYVFDMSKVLMPTNRNGYETFDRIQDKTETAGLVTEIRNLRVVPDDYDMTWQIGDDNDELAWGETNGYISNWVNKDLEISFDYFGYPVGSFSFASTISDRISEKFTFGANGKILSGSKEVGTYSESLEGNGWMSASIRLKDLGPNGSATADIKYIRNTDKGSLLFVKDFSCKELYDPSKDADMVWHLGDSNDELAWGETNGYISGWKGRNAVVTFDYHGNPSGNFSFANTSTDRVTEKFKFSANGKILSGSTEVGTYSESSFGNGWMSASVSLDLLDYGGKFADIKYIRNDSTGDLYVRNFTHVFNYDPASDAELVLKKNELTVIPDIPLWQSSVISFEIYHGTLDITCDPQFIFAEKNTESYVTSYFGYNDIGGLGLNLTNAKEGDYWIKASTQPEAISGNWYKWTIDLSELKAEQSRGGETIGKIFNRGGMDVYVRNFRVVSTNNPVTEDVLTLKALTNTAIPDIVHWSKSVITIDVYNSTLDRNSDPQFQFMEKGTEYGITGFFGYKKNDLSKLCIQNVEDNPYWLDNPTQPVDLGNGWVRWTLDLSKMHIEGENAGVKTIGFIKNKGVYDVYVKNITIVSITHNAADAVNENVENPTCTVDGSHDEVVYCSECNTELSRSTITDTKLGHDLVDDEAVPASCTAPGKEAGKHCSRCEYTEGGAAIDPTGHTNSEMVIENTVNPSCTVDGSHDEVIYCSVCTNEVSRSTITDTKLGHDLVDDEAVPASCTAPGKEAGKHCSRCEYTEGGATIDPTGHTNSEMVIENTVNPSCTVDGSHDEVIYCSVCTNEVSRNTITDTKLGHSYANPVFGEWTQSDNGYTITATQECSRCHDVINLTPTVTSESVNASCLVKGDITYKASVVVNDQTFNAENKVVEGQFAPHAFDEGTITKNPTCTDNGVKTFTCTVDGCTETKTEEIAALGHNTTKHEKVDATCLADGSIEYYSCDRCNKNFADQACTNEVSDLVVKGGHALTKVNAKNPTCDKVGYIDHNHCSVCDKDFDFDGNEIDNAVIPALGHKYQNNGKCLVCGFEGPDFKPRLEQVGCTSIISSSLMVLFALGSIIIIKRKKDDIE